MTRVWRVPAGLVACGSLVFMAAVGASVSAPTAGGGAHVDRGFVPAPLPPGGSPVLQPLQPASRNKIKLAGSQNWSGYVQSSRVGIFTSIEDTWTVPVVSTPSGEQFSSDWVGIGGFKSNDLVQAGTEADNIDGTPLYQAWTEILPATEDPLSMTISPGDSITTLVQETAPNTWLMQVTDNTTRLSQSRTVSYTSSGRSAEAIHERPCVGSPCSLGALATTNDVSFDPGTFTSTLQPTPQPLLIPAVQSRKVTKKRIKTRSDKLYELVMVSVRPLTILASPSVADPDGDGFTVADGSPGPPAPSS